MDTLVSLVANKLQFAGSVKNLKNLKKLQYLSLRSSSIGDTDLDDVDSPHR